MVLPSGPAGKAEGQSRKTARPGEERSAAGKALTLSYREPVCVRCGACMAVCPLYRLVGRETAVARGKLNLLNAWQEGRPPVRRLHRAMRCGATDTEDHQGGPGAAAAEPRAPLAPGFASGPPDLGGASSDYSGSLTGPGY
ncbi:MAG: hypothetical protein JRI59_07345 [Deltaproteobacteria bacterium]|nr:hypothetical protein [Deltaproteobacteria bacterium]